MINKLEQDGWKEWPVSKYEEYQRQWFKQVDTPSADLTNPEKKGIQLQIAFWDWKQHKSFCLHLGAETIHGWFMRLQTGVTKGDVDDRIADFLALWEFANQRKDKLCPHPA